MLRTRYCFDIEVGLFLRVSALPLFLKLSSWEISNNKTIIAIEELRNLILSVEIVSGELLPPGNAGAHGCYL